MVGGLTEAVGEFVFEKSWVRVSSIDWLARYELGMVPGWGGEVPESEENAAAIASMAVRSPFVARCLREKRARKRRARLAESSQRTLLSWETVSAGDMVGGSIAVIAVEGSNNV